MIIVVIKSCKILFITESYVSPIILMKLLTLSIFGSLNKTVFLRIFLANSCQKNSLAVTNYKKNMVYRGLEKHQK